MAMNEKQSTRIMICSSDKGSSYSLRHYLLRNKFMNLVFKPVEENLRSLIRTPQPDVIITTDQIWMHMDGIRQIEKLREYGLTPVIIWADRLNERVMSALSALKNVYYILKSDDERVLIDTILAIHGTPENAIELV